MIDKTTNKVLETSNIEPVKPKRGRKPKKDVTIISDNKNEEPNNILISIEETKEFDGEHSLVTDENILVQEELKSGVKKRGRKPKGGKIIQQFVPLNNNK